MANEKRLIDVNDALERLRKVKPKLHVVDFLGFKAVDIDAFIRFIESLKTVEAVEVVHGRWIDEYPYVRCSECTAEWLNCRTDNEPKHFHYCPNCGAKMGGDGNA